MVDDIINSMREALQAGPTPISPDLYGDRYMQGDYSRADLDKAQHDYIAAASPDRVQRLLDEVERLRADAARYQWLRDAWLTDPKDGQPSPWEPVMHVMSDAEMDAAIDAAMGKETGT